jgi:LPXTG-motif cell wall-anchored protein
VALANVADKQGGAAGLATIVAAAWFLWRRKKRSNP